jgi:putative transposase
MDFVHDKLWGGCRFRCLTVVDMFTRESLAIEVDRSLPGERVKRILEGLMAQRDKPEAIVVDNGPEFISQALDEWAYRSGIQLAFIRPGKPTDNAYVESFNGKFRAECLQAHYFSSLQEARKIIESWRVHYNTYRPHRALKGLTPADVMRQYLAGKTNSQVA